MKCSSYCQNYPFSIIINFYSFSFITLARNNTHHRLVEQIGTKVKPV